MSIKEKAATPLSEFEVEQWRGSLSLLMHDASLKTEIRWKQELRALATIDDLLAQLRDREEKLEGRVKGVLRDFVGRVNRRAEAEMQRTGTLEGAHHRALKVELDRILKGGD